MFCQIFIYIYIYGNAGGSRHLIIGGLQNNEHADDVSERSVGTGGKLGNRGNIVSIHIMCVSSCVNANFVWIHIYRMHNYA